MAYSSGKYAYGICDRTGFRYKIKDLVFEVENGVRTGLRVCYDVVDQDHTQNFLGSLTLDDTQSLLRVYGYLVNLSRVGRFTLRLTCPSMGPCLTSYQ